LSGVHGMSLGKTSDAWGLHVGPWCMGGGGKDGSTFVGAGQNNKVQCAKESYFLAVQ
jgi:hypothetical protein